VGYNLIWEKQGGGRFIGGVVGGEKERVARRDAGAKTGLMYRVFWATLLLDK
jgi:hypothetical protein